jgi:hypothetical protein
MTAKFRSPFLCRETGLVSEVASGRLAHIGAFFLWRQKQNKKSKIPKRLIANWIVWILAMSLGAIHHAHWIDAPWTDIFAVTAWFLVLMLWTPLILMSLRLQFRQTRYWITSPDFWVWLAVISALLNATQWSLSEFPHIHPPSYSIALALAQVWLLIRWLEAAIIRRKFRNTLNEESYFWATLIPRPRFLIRLIAMVTAVLAWLFLFSMGLIRELEWAHVFLVVAALWLPMGQWRRSFLMKASAAYQWVVQSFKDWAKLKQVKLVVCHLHGVLTEPIQKLDRLWMDPEALWTKDDVAEILALLRERSEHPIILAACASAVSQRKRSFFKLEDFQEISHLGIKAVVRDAEGSRVEIRLGHPEWHRNLQSSMSDEGRSALKLWIETKSMVSLLALNSEIVAGLTSSAKFREDVTEGLQNLAAHYKVCALSSSTVNVPDSMAFQATAQSLFPAERNVVLKRWSERLSPYVEVLAGWDEAELTGSTIRFSHPRPEQGSLFVESKDLGGLLPLLRSSWRWPRLQVLHGGYSAGACAALIVSCMLPWATPFVAFVALYLGGIAVSSFSRVD